MSVRTASAKRGILLIANNPKINVIDSELTVITEDGPGIYTNGRAGTITLNNTILNAVSTTSGNITMNGPDNKLILENQSAVDLTSTVNNNILISGTSPKLTVDGASLLNTTTGAADSIRLVGNAPTFKINGEGTEVEANSRHTINDGYGSTIYMGRS